MNKYIAKYFPLIDGRETEYTTTVEAGDKESAEQAIRRAYIEQIRRVIELTKSPNVVILSSTEELQRHIEYAKKDMRVEILSM